MNESVESGLVSSYFPVLLSDSASDTLYEFSFAGSPPHHLGRQRSGRPLVVQIRMYVPRIGAKRVASLAASWFLPFVDPVGLSSVGGLSTAGMLLHTSIYPIVHYLRRVYEPEEVAS